MRQRFLTLIALLFVWQVYLPAQSVDESYLSLQSRLTDVFKDRSEVIVQVLGIIQSAKTENEEQPKNLLFLGTGFFISKEGHILTNASICFSADQIRIEYKGFAYEAEAIGHDLTTNLSVLRIKDLPEAIKHVSLPNTTDIPEISTLVVSVSRQVGLPASPSLGMITGHNIKFGNRLLPTTYLRTNIPSQTGESGSPVFDLNGQLVGIMIASLPEINASFLLPVSAIRRVRDDIIFSGEVSYAWFGLIATEIFHPEFGRRMHLDDIIPNSPAAATQFKKGDLLLKIGNFEINNDRSLREAVFFTPPDQNVAVVVERDGQKLEFPMKTGRRTIAEPERPEDRQQAARLAAIPGQAIQIEPQTDSPSEEDKEDGDEQPKEDAPSKPQED